MSTSEIATVLAWHDALNTNDIDTLLNLSSTGIEVADSAGGGQGLTTLRQWATTAGLTLEPGRMFVYEEIVVVEEQEIWGSGLGHPPAAAAAFRVVQDQVTSIFRHPDLDTAFAATGLGEKDEFDAG